MKYIEWILYISIFLLLREQAYAMQVLAQRSKIQEAMFANLPP